MEFTAAQAALIVFLMAATPTLEIWMAIPAGLALGLDPLTAAAVSLAGNFAPMAGLTLGFERLRSWYRSRFEKREKRPPGRSRRRFDRLWERYGMPAAALTAPVTLGTHMVIVIVMSAGTAARPALAWMTLGLLAWAALITSAAVLGMTYLGF